MNPRHEAQLAIKDRKNPITAKSVAEEIDTSPENLRRQIRLVDGYMEEMLAG